MDMNRLTRPAGASALFAAVMAFSAVALAPGQAHASAEDFYKGKTIRIMSSTGAGGTMDLYILLLMKHMERHLPDGAQVVLEHRPGAGGTVGTNFLYGAAPKDGTFIGMPTPSVVANTFTQPDGVRYDPIELQPIGRLTDLSRVFVARSDSGVKTMADATRTEITHSVMPPGSTADQVAAAANEALGAKFRRVHGYSGGGPMFLAMEQGEVQSTTAEPGNLLSNKWDLVTNGTINVLAVIGLDPVPGLDGVPNLLDLVPADHPRRSVLEAVSAGSALGLSLYAPPGVPAERLAFLRDLVAKTINDPALVAEAKERNIPLNYADGDWVAERVALIAQQPDEVKDWFRSLSAK